MNSKPTTIEEYVASLPPDAGSTIEGLRTTIKTLAPYADELFSYGIPGYKYRGKPLIYIGAAKNHCALYGMLTEGFEEDLAGYDIAKGTIRFPTKEPPPASLIKKLIDARVASIDEAAASKKKPKATKTG